MRIKIIAIGKVREKYIAEGIMEYIKRIRPFCRLEILELKDEGLAKEAKKLEKHIDKNSYCMDIAGKEFSSEEFAGFIKKQSDLTFIIGGHEGLHDRVKKKAKKVSLSRMTFTHEMCRLFLVEQLYRSFMINSNRPYHK